MTYLVFCSAYSFDWGGRTCCFGWCVLLIDVAYLVFWDDVSGNFITQIWGFVFLHSLNKLCSKQSLLRSLWKKVRRLGKSTPPPPVVTNIRYAYGRWSLVHVRPNTGLSVHFSFLLFNFLFYDLLYFRLLLNKAAFSININKCIYFLKHKCWQLN